jgi:hypothetical protein
MSSISFSNNALSRNNGHWSIPLGIMTRPNLSFSHLLISGDCPHTCCLLSITAGLRRCKMDYLWPLLSVQFPSLLNSDIGQWSIGCLDKANLSFSSLQIPIGHCNAYWALRLILSDILELEVKYGIWSTIHVFNFLLYLTGLEKWPLVVHPSGIMTRPNYWSFPHLLISGDCPHTCCLLSNTAGLGRCKMDYLWPLLSAVSFCSEQ